MAQLEAESQEQQIEAEAVAAEPLEALLLKQTTLADYRALAERRGFKSAQDYLSALVIADQVDHDDILGLIEDELEDEEAERVRENFKASIRRILTDTLEGMSEEEFWAALKEED